MSDYISIAAAAQLFELAPRLIKDLCTTGRIRWAVSARRIQVVNVADLRRWLKRRAEKCAAQTRGGRHG